MSLEKIIFITLAFALYAFSMYRKAKRQRESAQQKEEEVYSDFPQETETYKTSDSVIIFDSYEAKNLPQYSDISTKKSKKRQKLQNIEVSNFQVENPKNISQTADLENDIALLGDFEGTELQKAFLFSEIFKNTKN